MVTAHIDDAGRVTLPATILEALGIGPDHGVRIEVTKDGILLRPERQQLTITERIAAMNLPAGEWGTMKREIEDGLPM